METLEQAAHKETVNNKYIAHLLENGAKWEACEVSFKAGAKWQKEQYNTLQSLLCTALPILMHTGYTDIATKLENELERLQD